jgi:NAD(P)-dependent dehydrogenase (short-subunit alcohol dehydrogenase family)
MSKLYPDFQKGLPNAKGKVFVITGTTSGTGFVAAQCVAEKQGTVVLLNRVSQRQVDSLSKLKAAVPEGDFVSIECDLQDFASVKKAALEVKAKYKSIYCLACNAGVMMTPDAATKDGCDSQMQTNHLSHFILTKELYPLLALEAEKTGDARVVYHSSGARDLASQGLEQKYFEKTGGDLGGDVPFSIMRGPASQRYAQSKLANSVMMYALHEKVQANKSKIRVTAGHPGGSATSLGGEGFVLKLPFYERWIMLALAAIMMQSAEDGAVGLLTGMMSTDAESGVLYGPKNSGLAGAAVPNPPKEYENNATTTAMLWKTSEETCGIKFDV